MRPKAVAKYIRMSPYKVRQVLDIIRGKSYTEAAAILEVTPRAAASVIKKVLDSAAANAEHNLSLNKDELTVASAFCDGGPTLKRMMPRARGSANRILKRTSHITIVLDSEGGLKDGTKG
ncbi:MAG: 50S ribosomal protein L22 [Candidatus Saccharimonadaceae bacterium]|nr:50S ribosomal protein L22 [Candidatus Saccharimonadaceae bacterium]MDD4002631.1 50S ribosomal protein L22 [Clostridia bacterium]